ncbi:superoxide dismutase [Cu-Zn] SodC [Parapusillimonas sp. JC17]|uniref:superoxide dismutase [Cu-Zn] SodC n=1 Tax=Parapusillimonas sp. JC17 TaxID=3445768 RepID=UPI003F9F1A76
MRHHFLIALSASAMLANAALADTTVQMHAVNAQGTAEAIGSVSISESAYGLVFTPQLKGLEPGVHGFHIHENPSCKPATKDGKPVAAGGAGDHFDPEKTGKHGAPWGDGHIGDLPAIYVDSNGASTNPVLAPRLKKLSDISGRSLMIHHGGDNHSDSPKPLGGGGARVACGVISAQR